ncbi:hypothetical protein KKG05_04960, partial [bacterium]|nr:hypothetical protein [bacterium]
TSTGGALFGPIHTVSLDITTTHSFYQEQNGARVNRFFWDRPDANYYSPLDIKSLSASISFSLKDDRLGNTFGAFERQAKPSDTTDTGMPVERKKIPTLFDRPYDIRFSFYHNESFTTNSKNTWGNADANLELTKKWSIGYNVRLNLDTKEVVSTGVQIHRDMHCWEGTLTWNPVGIGRGYFVRIALKSPQLRDVKIERTRGRGTFSGF